MADQNTVAASDRYRRRSGLLGKLKAHPASNILLVTAVFLLAMIAWTLVTGGQFSFFKPRNLGVLSQQIPITAIVALGVGLLMISGEFDISVAGTFTLVAFIVATLFGTHEMPLWIAICAGLGVAVLIGLANGFITCWLNVPSFITTIGMMFFLRGIIRYVSLNPTTNLPDSMAFSPDEGFRSILVGQVAGPVFAQLLWLLLFAFVTYLILNRHQVGNHMFAAGGNPHAARSVGVNVRRTKLIAFVICALAAGIAGVLQATRIGEIEPSFATFSGLELKVIAASVVGGVSLFGGVGSVLGIILGVFLIDAADNLLVLLGAPETLFKGILGALIITAAIINAHAKKKIG